MQAGTVTARQSEPVQKPAKDKWDKIQIIGTALLPVALTVGGFKINEELKERESINLAFAQERDRELRTFEVAISVLREDPMADALKQNSTEEPIPSALRSWAIKVFVEFSGEPIPLSVQKELETKALPSVSTPGGGTPASAPASSLFGEVLPGATFLGGPDNDKGKEK